MSKISSPASLGLLFNSLRELGYEWQPQTPDRLLSLRKDPSSFRPIVQLFGLGLPVHTSFLVNDGLNESILSILFKDDILAYADSGVSYREAPTYRSLMSVSRSGDLFVIHSHWPPSLEAPESAKAYVHYGQESAWLGRALQRDLENFIDKRVLDLGCSSGALSFEVAGVANEVLGIDISEEAINWAKALAQALGFRASLRFEAARIGDLKAETLAQEKKWDRVIFNPPMVVPAKDAKYPHRDGGKFGVELPLLFLDFSLRHLEVGGEVMCLATNPIIKGRPFLFDELKGRPWTYLEKTCLHPHFNQSVARKQGYEEQGIERIELWFLNLKRS